MMKVRLLMIVVLGIAVFSATSAFACEECFADDNFPDLGYSCWSGYEIGYQWCYGGGSNPCNKPKALDCPIKDPEDIERAAVEPVGSTRSAGVLGDGMRLTPDGGFVLERD